MDLSLVFSFLFEQLLLLARINILWLFLRDSWIQLNILYLRYVIEFSWILFFPTSWNTLLFYHPRNHFVMTQQLYSSMLKRTANHGKWTKSSPLPVFGRRVLLEHSHGHSFYILCVAASLQRRSLSNWDKRLNGPQNLKYLLSGPVQKSLPTSSLEADATVKYISSIASPLALFTVSPTIAASFKKYTRPSLLSVY